MNANRQKERPMQITTPNLIRWGGLSAMVTGIIFVLCVLLFRRGIVGEVIALFDRRVKAAV